MKGHFDEKKILDVNMQVYQCSTNLVLVGVKHLYAILTDLHASQKHHEV